MKATSFTVHVKVSDFLNVNICQQGVKSFPKCVLPLVNHSEEHQFQVQHQKNCD